MNTQILIQIAIFLVPITLIYFLYDTLGKNSGVLILILFNMITTVFFSGFILKAVIISIIMACIESYVTWTAYTKTNTYLGYCLLTISISLALVVIIYLGTTFLSTYHIYM